MSTILIFLVAVFVSAKYFHVHLGHKPRLRLALHPKYTKKLQVCEHFWYETTATRRK